MGACGGLFWLVHVPDQPTDQWWGMVRALILRCPNHVYGVCPRYDGQDDARFSRVADVAQRLGCPLIASAAPNDASRKSSADWQMC